ncbi:probable inactive purple acid phosphatase 27 isoform X2 [Aristolochia californica]|uniref:probable inactive purple acid phosphatase 27 isoform X2 n=1 Tax=Aristolochia californica TaxID=171875 RepID=UPI0035DCECAE
MWLICPVFRFSWLFSFLSAFFFSRCSSHDFLNSRSQFDNFTAISDFRILNRRSLLPCPNSSPYLELNISSSSALADEEYLTVTASGIQHPSELEWIAMISSAHSNVSSCPQSQILYQETGDLSNLPFLCHYPVKAQNLSADPDYLGCKKKDCKEYAGGVCAVTTCSSSLKFHIINIRTDIEFVLFGAGYHEPCVLKRSTAIPFANANKPLYGHLSSVDSTGTSMKLTWVSGGGSPQLVQYANGKSATSQVNTFTQNDMCRAILKSPANDFGWHDPGYIHSAVMTGLKPSATYSYKYGSDSVGWSEQINFKTPPAGGSNELQFLAYGDMGKAPRDLSIEHFIQPGSISVAEAITEEVARGKVDSIFHIGDISYATGFLVEWDYFLHLITPIASGVPYMTAIGNHERDFLNSGSVYGSPDSGGECGVPYETYFPMPTLGKDKPWYSIEQGSVHFSVISTEHDWNEGSEQYEWIKKDLGSVNRARTPWIVFTGFTGIGRCTHHQAPRG